MNERSKLKSAAKKALLASRALRLMQKKGVAVLMYHSVKDSRAEHANTLGDIVHSTSVFRQQMELLARRCSPVTMDDVLQFMQGEKDLPAQCFAVTFDDGYADNLEIAAPILDQLGIPGAFYVTVGYVETGKLPWAVRVRYAFASTKQESWTAPNGASFLFSDADKRHAAFAHACQYLSALTGAEQESAVLQIEQRLSVPSLNQPDLMLKWDQVRALAKHGHVVGSHTVSHPNLAYVKDDASLRHELQESKRQLDAQLGSPVRHFSYPVPALIPHWDSRTVAVSRYAGYATAVTTNPGMVSRHDDPLSLRRVRPAYDMDEFKWVIESSLSGRAV
jgi:peptidoglycan/xylan/chitin deacetylase (PgdA/CDA1 family)